MKSPNVTGNLIAGLILGPSVLNVIPVAMVDGFTVISDIALSFIAFSIGSEFDLNYYKKVGLAPVVIAIAESCGAILLVTGSMLLLGFDRNLSIMLGAIAAATAPAQTIMVISQYRAKGPLTSMLMSVVALDDATALIDSAVASTVVRAMTSTADTHIVLSILQPFYEIRLVCPGRRRQRPDEARFPLFQKVFQQALHHYRGRTRHILAGRARRRLAAFILHGAARACNIFDETDDIMKVTSSFTPPILMLFFVISGRVSTCRRWPGSALSHRVRYRARNWQIGRRVARRDAVASGKENWRYLGRRSCRRPALRWA
jgi:hypothetical protein